MVEGFIGTKLGRVHYVRQGSGPTLLLLHSNGNSVNEWEHVIGDLETSFDVIMVDQPGQGDSDGPGRHMTIDEYCDAFVEVLDELGVEKCAVAGTSIGGLFVISLGARYADRFTHNVVIEAMFRSDPEWADHWETVESIFGVPTQERAAMEHRFNEVSNEFLTRWNIDRNKAGTKSMMSTMWAIREYEIGRWAKEMTGKTLLLYGAKGPTVSTRAHLEAAVPECDVIVLENSGHFPMDDEPKAFAETITTFCSS